MANVGKWDRDLCNSRFLSCAPLVSSNLSGAVVSHDFPRFPTRKWSKVEFRSNQLKQNKTTRITFYEILSVGSQTGIIQKNYRVFMYGACFFLLNCEVLVTCLWLPKVLIQSGTCFFYESKRGCLISLILTISS